ncbi:MAG TPA: glycoside hydrolase [Acidimicrobiales bacterium]|nr:glycoside hydrolase [Acidimicrobiales bacterium]
MRDLRWAWRAAGAAVGLVAFVAAAAAPASAAVRRPHPRSHPHVRPTPGPARPTAADLRVSPERGQRIDGFGVSGGWWPTNMGRFPAAAQQQLGELLFAPTGLWVSQYRYNIGGGGVGVWDPYKAPPTFLTRAGTYDWGADPSGLAFLQMAAAYRVPQLIGFVNSAPASFTSNGKSCGGSLRPDRIGAFAGYLAQVTAHLDATDHIRLSYVSPMNEPDTSQPTCRQEGMTVPVGERAAVVDAVARALAALPGHPRVIADESSLVGQLLSEAPRWLPATRGAVAVIAHHTYDYPDQTTLSQVNRLPLTHWATEICCYDGSDFGWQYDPTMGSGLWLARTIFGDLGAAHDSAFDWWVAASPNVGCDPTRTPGCQDHVNPAGRNDGLVYYDPNWRNDGNDTLYLTKRYWVLASFSRYVRPGAVLHQISGLPAGAQALAFEKGRDWSVVAANDSSTRTIDAVIHLPSGVAAGAARAYVTDARSNLAPIAVATGNGTVSISLPPRSLTCVLVGAHEVTRGVARTSSHSGPQAAGSSR